MKDLLKKIEESYNQDTELGKNIISLLEETYGYVDWATRVEIKRLIKITPQAEVTPAV